jgi:hypothetical protein
MKSDNHLMKMARLGGALSVLGVLPFCLAATMKFSQNPKVIEGMGQLGWPGTMILPLAVLETTSVVLYLIPQVSVLGAIVLTGFLGGAMATHLRVGQPVYLHVVLGLLIWGGLYLREPRLRHLIPFRRP